MPIDPEVAVGADLGKTEFAWSSTDVLLYHLALGAGGHPTEESELRYVLEDRLQVLPTFGVVAPNFRMFEPPAVTFPGVDVDLSKVLHGTQEITVHRQLPTSGRAVASSRIADVWDKGKAAVIVQEAEVTDLAGTPLWTTRSGIFARGEGNFGGNRGPALRLPPPHGAPKLEIEVPTLPQQALLYRLCGDRNPLHADPAFAVTAGFDRPILHGLCSYGFTGRALLQTFCGNDSTRFEHIEARFASPVMPGEALTISMWELGTGEAVFTTSVGDRVVIDQGLHKYA